MECIVGVLLSQAFLVGVLGVSSPDLPSEEQLPPQARPTVAVERLHCPSLLDASPGEHLIREVGSLGLRTQQMPRPWQECPRQRIHPT